MVVFHDVVLDVESLFERVLEDWGVSVWALGTNERLVTFSVSSRGLGNSPAGVELLLGRPNEEAGVLITGGEADFFLVRFSKTELLALATERIALFSVEGREQSWLWVPVCP